MFSPQDFDKIQELLKKNEPQFIQLFEQLTKQGNPHSQEHTNSNAPSFDELMKSFQSMFEQSPFFTQQQGESQEQNNAESTDKASDIDAQIEALKKRKAELEKLKAQDDAKDNVMQIEVLHSRRKEVLNYLRELDKLFDKRQSDLNEHLDNKAKSFEFLHQIHTILDKQKAYQDELEKIDNQISFFK